MHKYWPAFEQDLDCGFLKICFPGVFFSCQLPDIHFMHAVIHDYLKAGWLRLRAARILTERRRYLSGARRNYKADIIQHFQFV